MHVSTKLKFSEILGFYSGFFFWEFVSFGMWCCVAQLVLSSILNDIVATCSSAVSHPRKVEFLFVLVRGILGLFQSCLIIYCVEFVEWCVVTLSLHGVLQDLTPVVWSFPVYKPFADCHATTSSLQRAGKNADVIFCADVIVYFCGVWAFLIIMFLLGFEMWYINYVIARICFVRMYDSSGFCRNPSV